MTEDSRTRAERQAERMGATRSTTPGKWWYGGMELTESQLEAEYIVLMYGGKPKLTAPEDPEKLRREFVENYPAVQEFWKNVRDSMQTKDSE